MATTVLVVHALAHFAESSTKIETMNTNVKRELARMAFKEQRAIARESLEAQKTIA